MEPITLSAAEIASGIEFSNQYRQFMASAAAARQGEGIFIEHLRKAHDVPADWILIDWLVGFVPPQGDQHGHNHD